MWFQCWCFIAGAIFSASNAALMLAQMGDRDAAIKEVKGVGQVKMGTLPAGCVL